MEPQNTHSFHHLGSYVSVTPKYRLQRVLVAVPSLLLAGPPAQLQGGLVSCRRGSKSGRRKPQSGSAGVAGWHSIPLPLMLLQTRRAHPTFSTVCGAEDSLSPFAVGMRGPQLNRRWMVLEKPFCLDRWPLESERTVPQHTLHPFFRGPSPGILDWGCVAFAWLRQCLETPGREPLLSEEAISSSMMPPIEYTWN